MTGPVSIPVSIETIYKAKTRLKAVASSTPLQYSPRLSERYQCKVYLKREDLQVVRSYKIRGAYNKIAQLPKHAREAGIVCASAGNHAQGVAYACATLGINGTIFMPEVTPQQKVRKVQQFGKEWVTIQLIGDTFDASFQEAMRFCEAAKSTFIHPFDDLQVIQGQATVGLEIFEDCPETIDFLLLPIGGGGLAAGVGSFFRQVQSETRIYGVEPAGAPAMHHSLQQGERVLLDHIDSFVDGAAVRRVGQHTFAICKEILEDVLLVPEGKVCSSILQLYNEDGIVVEPAGALSISALDLIADQLKGKTVVCVVSGSNNDITRTEEIRERALLYEGKKHYFIIRFPQRAGALRDFLNNVLGPKDDITHFEYTKKHNRESGPALVGIQLEQAEDYQRLLERMEEHQIDFETLNDRRMLFELLI
ncbi:MAG: threonine ammonia-lyase IlvA [Phaeodactylibacter sp.]|nr:threonine ammonia-lyase IlvA [Phaeodactylibacter sp.]